MNHQELMDAAHEKWNDNLNYNQFIDMLPKAEKYAVLFGNMNYQIGNGGWYQWCDNGYCTRIKALVNALTEMNTDTSNQILKMLDVVKPTLKYDVLDGSKESRGCCTNYFKEKKRKYWDDDDDDDDDDEHPNFESIDTQYYELEDKFMEECEVFLATLQ